MQKKIEVAILELAKGSFILVHDFHDREDEVDLVCIAVKCTKEHIYKMRRYAGGQISVALHAIIAKKLNLPYIVDVYSGVLDKFSIFTQIPHDCASPYGDKPSFSISVNHIDTYSGVTDSDRALTIREIGIIGNHIYRNLKSTKYYQTLFGSQFRIPGHTPLLIANKDLLKGRLGHTELSIALAYMGGISPVSVLCEMLDKETGKSLTIDKAREFAEKNNLIMVSGNEIIEAYEEHLESCAVIR